MLVRQCKYMLCMGIIGVQEKALDPLKLELQVVVNCLVWVLGTKHVSLGKSASAPNH